ncbi:MAG TPA: phage major capsid protein [Pyrinomonadaceae bacterium]
MTDKANKDPQSIIGTRQRTTLSLNRAEMTIDEEKRTAEMSFASDLPIEHWFGKLILDMSSKAVVLDRFKAGAPLLVCHDRRMQAGVIEQPKVADGKLRGTSRFSRSTFGSEIFQDVVDGIRTTTSLGFIVHEMVLEESKDGEDIYRATKWEPFEGSLEPIAADISVGVGRALDETSEEEQPQQISSAVERATNNTPIEVRTAMEPKENSNISEPTAIERAQELIDYGTIFGEEDLARDLAAEGKDLTALRTAIAAKRKQAQTTTPKEDPAVVATRNGGSQPARVITRYGTLRNFKGEGAEERAYRFAQWFLGGPLGMSRSAEYCRAHGITLVRGQVESVNEKGGFLVPEEFGNDLIDLRETYGVFRRNAKIVPMAGDVRSDPRRTGGLTAYFVDEGDEGTESEKGWDRVGLRAKKLMVLARMSSEITEDAAINMGDDLAGEIGYAFAQKEDQCGFNGDGTSAYGGIVGVRSKLKGLSGTIGNIAGLHVGAGNAYSELLLEDFEAVVGLLPEYADTPMAKWFVHRSFYYNVMVKVMLASGGVTAAEIESSRTKRFMGYDVEFSQAMPKSAANSQVCALLGDLAKAASLGSRRDTTIALSEHSRFRSDEIEIKGTERVDINVHSVGNAAASADDREAGPVVGLITAAS